MGEGVKSRTRFTFEKRERTANVRRYSLQAITLCRPRVRRKTACSPLKRGVRHNRSKIFCSPLRSTPTQKMGSRPGKTCLPSNLCVCLRLAMVYLTKGGRSARMTFQSLWPVLSLSLLTGGGRQGKSIRTTDLDRRGGDCWKQEQGNPLELLGGLWQSPLFRYSAYY